MNTNPYRTVGESGEIMSGLPETDRQRRQRETTDEHNFMRAWWEAYKISLASCTPSQTASVSDVANLAETEYRVRYAATMTAIERIWDGYMETGQDK